NSVTALEGDTGSSPFVFTVSLSNPSDQRVTVRYATTGGTAAAADSDYVTAADTLSFAPLETSKTITVMVNGDATAESDETFFVKLMTSTNANIAAGQDTGTGTILNDDRSTLTISSPSVVEGTGGTNTMTFTVTSSAAVQGGFSVAFSAMNGTALSSDFSAITPSPLVFTGTAGETQMISVNIDTDVTFETDETFTVRLGSVSAATPVQAAAIASGAVGTGTIMNDDPMPSLSVTSVAAPEGNTGTTA